MEYTVEEIKKLLHLITDEIIAAKEELTDIDSRLGDGDMGMSMEKGALAMKAELDACDDRNISHLFMSCARAFNRAAPSTMGTLLSSGMLAIAKQTGNQEALSMEQIALIPQVLADAIQMRGKASVGDKTILDALVPYADTLKSEYDRTKEIGQALMAASEAAHEGMESTKGRIAKAGRAKWLAERNMEYPDGGAVLCDRIGRMLVLYAKAGKTEVI